MSQIIEISAVQFADHIGMSLEDKAVLQKKYNHNLKKTPEEWQKLLKNDFILPREISDTVFTAIEKQSSTTSNKK